MTQARTTLSPRERFRRMLRRAWRRLGIRAVVFSLVVGIGFATLMFVIEHPSNNLYATPWDALWWVLVTMTTTGYGDVVPKTFLGRVVAGFTILAGLGLFSLFTALIASVLVTESLREARGLEAIRNKGHILLLGWNWRAEQVLEALVALYGADLPPIVMVNQLPEEDVNEVLQKFNDVEVHFLRGDFTHEAVLERANVMQAAVSIILADASAGGHESDERTVLGCLAVKHLNPELKVIGELLNAQDEQHLRRARADEVIIGGEFNSFLLASSVGPSGISKAVRHLLTPDSSTRLDLVDVPTGFVNRPFGEMAAYVRDTFGQLAIGVVAQARVLNLADVLSADYTAVDEFIERKFDEAGLPLDSLTQERVQVNPGDSYVLRPQDRVLVIGRGA